MYMVSNGAWIIFTEKTIVVLRRYFFPVWNKDKFRVTPKNSKLDAVKISE